MAPAPTIRAVLLSDVARMEIRDIPNPAPGPRDVRLRVEAVGLCGTDFHIFEGHGNYHTDARGRRVPLAEHPQILGHEVVGRVETLGRDVTDLAVGDRVVLDQGHNCASAGLTAWCEYCVTGDSHQCEHYREHGITGLPGGLAEAMVVPAVNLVRITTDLPSSEAVLTEPLACIVHAIDRARHAAGRYTLDGDARSRARSVLITGAGPAGLLFLQYLTRVLRFDGRILVSEPDPGKRALAELFGGETIDPSDGGLVDAVLERTAGRRADWVIEASGSARVLTDLAALMRKQATVVAYGHGHTGIDISVISNIQFKEPTLVSPVGASGALDEDGRPAVHRRALALIADGRVQVRPFVTHRYASLDAVPAAFAGAHRAPGYIKGVVEL